MDPPDTRHRAFLLSERLSPLVPELEGRIPIMYAAAVAAAAAIDADKRALGFVGYRRPGTPDFPFSHMRPAGEHRTLAQGGVVSVSTGMSTSRAGVPVMNQCLSRWRTSCCCTRAADQRHTARAGRACWPSQYTPALSHPRIPAPTPGISPGILSGPAHTHTHTHTHTYTHTHTPHCGGNPARSHGELLSLQGGLQGGCAARRGGVL